MAKKKPYTTCAACGAALDPGERCDCSAEERKPTYDYSNETPEQKARRRAFVFALCERGRKRRSKE